LFILLFVYVETFVMFIILPECSKDREVIEILLDDVFGDTRQHKASYAYRDKNPPVQGLSLSAHCNERLVGTIRFWPIVLGFRETPALLLGPLGVASDMQNFGIGRSLISQGHMMAAEIGYKLVLLVGEETYYGRFGYVSASSHGLFMQGENPTRLMVRELGKGALQEASGHVQAGDCPRPSVIGSGIAYQASC
jgi:predicted N-acetyltransferase YhbS